MTTSASTWVFLVFCLGFALLVAHELDAVRAREWRLLLVLRRMPEDQARTAFVLLHIPIVAVLLWLVSYPAVEVRTASQIAVDLFLIVHAGLHWRLRNHPLYDFHSATSWALIVGAAGVGVVHLLLLTAVIL